jgi:Cation/multidrug efflux pump
MTEVGGISCDRSRALFCFYPYRVYCGHYRHIFSPIRADHCGLDRDLRTQFAHTVPCPRCPAPQAARREEGFVPTNYRWVAWMVLQRIQQNIFLGLERIRQHGRRLVRLAVVVLFVYAGLLALTGVGFKVVPGGFLPTQDRGYAVVYAQLPDAASLERTQAVVDKISKIAHETPGILNTVEFAGFNLFGGNQPNTAAVFLPFKEFSERKTRDQSLPAILAKINARVRAEIPEALVIAFPASRVRHW